MWEYLAFIVIAIMIVLRLYRRVPSRRIARVVVCCVDEDKDQIVPEHDSRLESRRNAQSRDAHRCANGSLASPVHNEERDAIGNRIDAMPSSAIRDAHLYHYYHPLGFAALSASSDNEHQ